MTLFSDHSHRWGSPPESTKGGNDKKQGPFSPTGLLSPFSNHPPSLMKSFEMLFLLLRFSGFDREGVHHFDLVQWFLTWEGGAVWGKQSFKCVEKVTKYCFVQVATNFQEFLNFKLNFTLTGPNQLHVASSTVQTNLCFMDSSKNILFNSEHIYDSTRVMVQNLFKVSTTQKSSCLFFSLEWKGSGGHHHHFWGVLVDGARFSTCILIHISARALCFFMTEGSLVLPIHKPVERDDTLGSDPAGLRDVLMMTIRRNFVPRSIRLECIGRGRV